MAPCSASKPCQTAARYQGDIILPIYQRGAGHVDLTTPLACRQGMINGLLAIADCLDGRDPLPVVRTWKRHNPYTTEHMRTRCHDVTVLWSSSWYRLAFRMSLVVCSTTKPESSM